MLNIRIIPFLFALLVFVGAQEILAQEILGGSQRPMKKQNRQVPRYYICGAGVWKKRQFTPAGQKCREGCDKKYRRGKYRYECWTHCDPIPEVHHWTRINGIRVQYCHFQNWNNQMTLEETGTYNWQGMKFCPQGMYVYGMRTKLSERDGLAGLILYCRDMRSTNKVSEILIFDGEGAWRDIVASKNYAVGFRTRVRESFIYGLKLQMAAVPYIFAFNFKYQFPKDFNTVPIQIQKVTVNNLGSLTMTKQIEITKEKQFQRMWQNEKGYLQGQSISQIFSQSLKTTSSIGIPFLSSKKVSNVQRQQIIQSRRQERFQTFKFGVIETFKVGQRQKDIVHIPPCTKYSILQTVYIFNADVPYILQIGYSNGQTVEYQNINGVYKGVSVGQVQTTVNMQNLCKNSS